MTYQQAPPIGSQHALFLDLDGTLVDFQDNPTAVRAAAALCGALEACYKHLAGALALVSGRRLSELNMSMAPYRFPAAGLHGLERRDARGTEYMERVSRAALTEALASLRASLANDSFVRVEDKGLALAIHFRAAPERGAAIRIIAQQVLVNIGPDYRLLEGANVVELLPREASKGVAVRAFMKEPPFIGRRPVFVGDDVTDLDGFAAARELGGYGIAVGNRIIGEYGLANVPAVKQWLLALAESDST